MADPLGWTSFRHGALNCTVVSDGVIELGPARQSFPNADPDEVDELLRTHYLPTDAVRINENVLVVETGAKTVMFDCGVGTDPEFGGTEFGSGTGLLLRNLASAGLPPDQIDIIALTHAHPDHSWGLAAADGSRVFPHARVAISRVDFEYWTDLSRVPDAVTAHQQAQIWGAHKNLTAYADNIMLLDGDCEVVPGVHALSTPGHSPGHMVYDIMSDGKHLICWGDLCHHEVLLLQRPEWAFMFDFDGPSATDQRRRIYRYVDEGRHAVFGYHFPFPGLGHIRQDGEGYTWVPTDMQRYRAQHPEH